MASSRINNRNYLKVVTLIIFRKSNEVKTPSKMYFVAIIVVIIAKFFSKSSHTQLALIHKKNNSRVCYSVAMLKHGISI